MKRIYAALALGLLSVASPVWAQRTDVVLMKNGDRLTCKVKQLDRGRLKVQTDHMGTVYVDWTHVASVEASRTFEVELESGAVFYGGLDSGAGGGSLVVRSAGGTETLPIDGVVYVTEIKRGFFKRLQGSIDIGFNYQKANSDVNYSVSADAVYRTKKNETELDYSSILSTRNDSPRAFRNVLHGTYTHFLRGRWHVVALASAEQNDELGLDLRTAVGAGAGRYLFQTNRSHLAVGAGLTTNREQYFTDPTPVTSLEALVNASFDFFVHGDLGTDLAASLTLFPSLTEDDRYRLEFSGKYRQEIVKDFFLAVSGWYSFDSQAPLGDGTTVRQDDYGVVTSVGWDF